MNLRENQALRPNVILNERYEIKKLVGAGEFSLVYLAYDLVLLQEVAVKEFFPQKYSGRDEIEEAEKANFVREVGVIFGKYEWKGIPGIKDFFRENHTVYAVMEYLPGKNLKEYLAELPQQRIPAEKAVKMMIPVMKALTFLHTQGMVHCGISLEKICVRENGECCLLGNGTLWVKQEFIADGMLRAEQGFSADETLRAKRDFAADRALRDRQERNFGKENPCAAPEFSKKKEWIGPWSDVWGICAVLYEMITGKKTQEKCKMLSDFAEVDSGLEQAILQGLSGEIQQRFFYMGTFLERFYRNLPNIYGGKSNIDNGILNIDYGMSDNNDIGDNIAEILEMQGKIQEVWGEKWLMITTSGEEIPFGYKKSGRIPFTKKQKRNLKIAGILLLAAVGCAGIGLEWKARQPKSKEEVLKNLQEISQKEEYGNVIVYKVMKDFVKENGLNSDYLHEFPVQETEVKEWIERFFETELKDSANVVWNGNVFVHNGALQKLSVSCYETVQYKIEFQGNEITAEWQYDVTDGYVNSVSFTSERDVSEEILKELLPFLVPEAYLTEDEITAFYDRTQEDGYYRLDTHGKYVLCLNQYDFTDETQWEMSIENYLNAGERAEKNQGAGGDAGIGTNKGTTGGIDAGTNQEISGENGSENEKEVSVDREVYAGNYARGSGEYDAYIEFLETRAVSKERMEEGWKYILDEAAVEEWGQPSNKFVFDINRDVLMQEVEASIAEFFGEGMKLTREENEFRAEVFDGGAIETCFYHRERYEIADTLQLIVLSDYLSGAVHGVYVYDEENQLEKTASLAAEVLMILSEDVIEEGESAENSEAEKLPNKDILVQSTEDSVVNNLLSQLKEYEEIIAEPGNGSSTMMASLADCGYTLFLVGKGEQIGVYFEHHAFSLAENGFAPYNWP